MIIWKQLSFIGMGLLYVLLGSQSYAQDQAPKGPLISYYLEGAFTATDRLRKPDIGVPLVISVSCSDTDCNPYVTKLEKLLNNARIRVTNSENHEPKWGISIIFSSNTTTMKHHMEFNGEELQKDPYPGCSLIVGAKGYSIKHIAVYVQVSKTYEELYTCVLVQLARGSGLTGVRSYERILRELNDAKLGKEKFEIVLKGFAGLLAVHTLNELKPGFTKGEAEATLTKLDFEYIRATPYSPGATIFKESVN